MDATTGYTKHTRIMLSKQHSRKSAIPLTNARQVPYLFLENTFHRTGRGKIVRMGAC